MRIYGVVEQVYIETVVAFQRFGLPGSNITMKPVFQSTEFGGSKEGEDQEQAAFLIASTLKSMGCLHCSHLLTILFRQMLERLPFRNVRHLIGSHL